MASRFSRERPAWERQCPLNTWKQLTARQLERAGTRFPHCYAPLNVKGDVGDLYQELIRKARGLTQLEFLSSHYQAATMFDDEEEGAEGLSSEEGEWD